MVVTKPEHDEVSFVGCDPARCLLVDALQDKHEFKQLLLRAGARKVSGIDGQMYYLSPTETDAFIREFGWLVEGYIPEISG
jgi:hypothetical protein